MPDSKKLSIIIVNYNSASCITKCVSSIYEKLGKSSPWEIIIVNSDEKENINQLPLDFSRIRLIDHKKNIGFGAGINMGVYAAKGEYLLFLNPDTQLISSDLNSLIDSFSNDASIGAIGCKVIDETGKTQDWIAGKEISLWNLIKNNLGLERKKPVWSSLEKIECDWVAGTAMFMKKSVFNCLGDFDDKFFMYFEDMDLCRRVRIKGNKVIYYPDFTVLHVSGQSYKDKGLQKKHYYDSMEKYFKKNRGWWEWIVIKILRKLFF